MFSIVYSKKAEKFLEKQSLENQKRIRNAIEKLPSSGDIKKLQGVIGYRLRVGNFRVIFDINGYIIDIVKIDNRGQVYKGV